MLLLSSHASLVMEGGGRGLLKMLVPPGPIFFLLLSSDSPKNFILEKQDPGVLVLKNHIACEKYNFFGYFWARGACEWRACLLDAGGPSSWPKSERRPFQGRRGSHGLLEFLL